LRFLDQKGEGRNGAPGLCERFHILERRDLDGRHVSGAVLVGEIRVAAKQMVAMR